MGTVTSADGSTSKRVRTSLGALVVIALVGTGLTTSTATADVTKPKVAADTKSGTALKVDWTDVKGAASYRVQYSADQELRQRHDDAARQGRPGDHDERDHGHRSDDDKTYFVRVADVSDSGKVGTYSAATEAKAAFKFDAPGDIFRSKVDRDSMTASWKAVSGAPGYTVRVYSKGNPTKFFTTTSSSVNLTGLKSSTNYYIRAYVVQPAAGSTDEVRLSDDSPEISPGHHQLQAGHAGRPEGDEPEPDHASGWPGPRSPALPGRPEYKVSYAYNYAQTDHQKTSGALQGHLGQADRADERHDVLRDHLAGRQGRQAPHRARARPRHRRRRLVPRGTISG